MKNNQKIKCNVKSCKFQNSDLCTLTEIQIGSNHENVTKDKETLCESFECNKEKTETSK